MLFTRRGFETLLRSAQDRGHVTANIRYQKGAGHAARGGAEGRRRRLPPHRSTSITHIRSPIDARVGIRPGGPGQPRSRQRCKWPRGAHAAQADFGDFHAAGADAPKLQRDPQESPCSPSAATTQTCLIGKLAVIDNEIETTTARSNSSHVRKRESALWPAVHQYAPAAPTREKTASSSRASRAAWPRRPFAFVFRTTTPP